MKDFWNDIKSMWGIGVLIIIGLAVLLSIPFIVIFGVAAVIGFIVFLAASDGPLP